MASVTVVFQNADVRSTPTAHILAASTVTTSTMSLFICYALFATLTSYSTVHNIYLFQYTSDVMRVGINRSLQHSFFCRHMHFPLAKCRGVACPNMHMQHAMMTVSSHLHSLYLIGDLSPRNQHIKLSFKISRICVNLTLHTLFKTGTEYITVKLAFTYHE